MKSSYDIILYFSWVHSSHIHKYLALKEQLNKHANTLLIFDNGRFGVTADQIKPFEPFMQDTIVANLRKANEIIFDYNPKILILGSDKQTLPWQRQINYQLKSTTIQLPHFIGVDVYYSGTDFLAVSGPAQEAINKNVPNVVDVKNKLNINPWLYDLTEQCLPNNLTREGFCKKYNLNPEKEIFIWLPDTQLAQKNINCFGGPPLHDLPGHNDTLEEATSRYRAVCNIENVIVKVHPNEFKDYNPKSDKWSYEVSNASAPVIDPIDTHWAYKYSDCGIGYTTSAGLEFGFFETPKYQFQGLSKLFSIISNVIAEFFDIYSQHQFLFGYLLIISIVKLGFSEIIIQFQSFS